MKIVVAFMVLMTVVAAKAESKQTVYENIKQYKKCTTVDCNTNSPAKVIRKAKK